MPTILTVPRIAVNISMLYICFVFAWLLFHDSSFYCSLLLYFHFFLLFFSERTPTEISLSYWLFGGLSYEYLCSFYFLCSTLVYFTSMLCFFFVFGVFTSQRFIRGGQHKICNCLLKETSTSESIVKCKYKFCFTETKTIYVTLLYSFIKNYSTSANYI